MVQYIDMNGGGIIDMHVHSSIWTHGAWCEMSGQNGSERCEGRWSERDAFGFWDNKNILSDTITLLGQKGL